MTKILRTLIVSFSGLLLLASMAAAQTNQPPTGAGVISAWDTIQGWFDLGNSNSLVNAQELSLTPLIRWDSASEKAGGAARLDWYITDQQGATFTYSEYEGRESFWQMGYQARTVFKGLEVSVASGVIQNTDIDFGEVRLYLAPTFTWKLPIKKLDGRLVFGADLVVGEKPSPYAGMTFRFSR